MKNKAVRSSAIVLFAAFLIATLSACAAPKSTPAPTTGVTGTLTFVVKSPLPADAVAEVNLVDITAISGEPQVIGSQSITIGNQTSPIQFDVKYDASKINAEHSYGISAKIVKGNDEYFTTSEPAPVLTQGKPSSGVDVVLKGAGTEAP